MPSRLLLDVPGAGRLPVSRSLAPGASAPGAAVADALDIRVAGTWVLSTSALATLVDSVGGVSVDVDVDVPKGAGEGAAILASAGDDQRLNGSQAAAYAQLLVGDEPEAVRLARQERVVTAVLAALPEDARPSPGVPGRAARCPEGRRPERRGRGHRRSARGGSEQRPALDGAARARHRHRWRHHRLRARRQGRGGRGRRAGWPVPWCRSRPVVG